MGSGKGEEREVIAEAAAPIRPRARRESHLSRLGVFKTNPVQANFAGFSFSFS